MAKVVKLAVARKKKEASVAASELDRKLKRAEDHTELLTLNEFNFESPDDDTIIIHEPGRAWLHRISAVFGLPRFPTNEAELLGTQQMLLFLVYAAKPANFSAKEDANWLAAGKGVMEDTAPWALNWFEAYLVNDVDAMRQAMIDDEFIENAAEDWRATEAERAALTMGNTRASKVSEERTGTVVQFGPHRDKLREEQPETAGTSEEQPSATTARKVTRKKRTKQDADALPDRIFFRYNVEGAGLGVSRLTYERDQRRQELINENIEYDDFNYADYGPDPIKQEYLDWWTRNIAPLRGWKRKKSKAKAKPTDWRDDPVLAPLLDKRRKGSTLRKQLALLDETGNYSTLRAWLTSPTMHSSSDDVLSILINNQILRAFARAGRHEEFIPVLARYAQHVSVGTDPANSGPLCGTRFMLPIRPYYNPSG